MDDVLYDTLLAYNSSNKLVGSLASSFALTPDASAVKVTLRSGVKFHDGSTLTAKDVKFSFDRYVSIGQGTASHLANYKSTTVTDDTHLTINLKHPDALFLGSLSKLYILSEKTVTAHAGSDQGQAWLGEHDAGSGPYKIHQGSVPVSVDRFADFWAYNDKRPKQIIWNQIAESSTKLDELTSGQLDIGLNMQYAHANTAAKANGLKVAWAAVPNADFIFFNTASGPTANPDVRKALRLAYNYTDGLSRIRFDRGTIGNGPLPQTLPCLTDEAPFKQDLNKAKALLKSAGQSHLTLTLRFQPSLNDQVKEATLYQSDLRRIGVTLNLSPITFPDYITSLSRPSTIPQMALVGDTAPEPDPGIYLRTAYSSPKIGTTNRAGYHNAQVDSLLEKAATTTGEKARCDIYRQVQRRINADAPAIDVATLQAPLVYRDGLKGVTGSQTVFPMSLRPVTLR
ncbi:ABC transporter substrate-binding protein [Streptomyces sp. NPDC046821]|uniref:ABC transporter substrate-binding protein n=1 Tax=Streptomyces sp. NPDC046821 TaxID=3154702 RepID=UPI00340107E5